MACGDGWTRKYDQEITVQVLPVSPNARYTMIIRTHHKDSPEDPLDETFNTEELTGGISWNLEESYRYDMRLAIQTASAKVNPKIWFDDTLAYNETCKKGTNPVTCRFTVAVWEKRS